MLCGLLAGLQYRLWFGDGSLSEVMALQGAIAQQETENRMLRMRNAVLVAEVVDLKQGLAAIEARAREDLGMIKHDETFYRVLEFNDEVTAP